MLFDPSTPGRYAAAVATWGLLALRARRTKQAQHATDLASGGPASPLSATDGPVGVTFKGWAALAVPLLGAADLVLTAASLVCYHAQTGAEQEHVTRAHQVEARVDGTYDGYQQTFDVTTGPSAGSRLALDVAANLPVGAQVPLLLDPSDSTWERLVSEPKGYTYWFGWAVLGAFAATWSALYVAARARTTSQLASPVPYRVRATRSERAVEILFEGTPVAVVPLADGGPRLALGSVPALVRGPVADAGWVGITTGASQLPVVGPVRATPRWRPWHAWTSARSHARTSALARRMASTADRAHGVWSTLVVVGLGAAGCLALWLALSQAGPAWDAAHGRGAPGSFTVRSEDCTGKGPCRHYGDFASSNGRYTFTDVEIVGASADVGSSIPALYEGDGQTPDAVYGRGWSGLAESGVFLGVALFLFAQPVGRLAGAVTRRRRPPTGRHAQGVGE